MHDRKTVCPKKLALKQARIKKETSASKFRSTRAWSLKSKEIRSRDLFLCQWCLKEGKYTFDGLEVHHITPISKSWHKRLDNYNLITLCSFHHKLADKDELNKNELLQIARKKEGEQDGGRKTK
jgi:5-methylcytosine-specific restriction endonuclease McrA